MKKLLVILMMAIAGSISQSDAQQPGVVVSDTKGWHKIGETMVDFQKDTDVIVVMLSDRFASLKFKVTQQPINLKSLTVYYEDGTKDDIYTGFPFTLKSPGESRVIDLKGKESSLKKVELVYSTVSNAKDQKAHVELWGLKTNVEKTKLQKKMDNK